THRRMCFCECSGAVHGGTAWSSGRSGPHIHVRAFANAADADRASVASVTGGGAIHGGTACLRIGPARTSVCVRSPAREPAVRKRAGSPPSQCVHDFDPVAVVQEVVVVAAAGHDRAVDLDRHAAAAQALLFEQGQHRGVVCDGQRVAVELDVHARDCRPLCRAMHVGRDAVRREADARLVETCAPCGPVLWPSSLIRSRCMHRSKPRSTPAIAMLAAALALASAPALAEDTFSRTVFFGDSLTDAGYFRPLLVQQNPQAAILGRFTTNPGLVWAEWLALAYGTDARPNGNGQAGDNYAAGGAMV